MVYIIIYVVRVYILYNSAFLLLEIFKGLTPAAFNSLYKPPGHQANLLTICEALFIVHNDQKNHCKCWVYPVFTFAHAINGLFTISGAVRQQFEPQLLLRIVALSAPVSVCSMLCFAYSL